MAQKHNGTIIDFCDGQLRLSCGQTTLEANAHIADCSGDGCRLEGTITNGPFHIHGRAVTVISPDRQDAIVSIRRPLP